MNPKSYLIQCQKKVNATLDKVLPKGNIEPCDLHEAMRYAVLNGGKRVRAALVYATGEVLGAKPSLLNPIAAAMEMIHAFSLIHDDLPAIDNDDLRRGKPTCHKVFGEATAILAGDALHTYAFEMICSLPQKYLPAKMIVQMTLLLARAVGSQGLIGGEELDIKMTNQPGMLEKIEKMYQLKTGCLIHSCVMLGALAANCEDKKTLQNLSKFGYCLGLLFQIHDDIIGIESTTQTLGKTQGKDLLLEKTIYPLLLGMDKTKQKEQALHDEALSYLKKSKINPAPLTILTDFIVDRNY